MVYNIRKKATEFRNKNGYSSLEPIDLESFLIKLNVITIFKPLSSNFSGMAIKSNDKGFMLINSNHSIGRQNFSICHELYHLYFDTNFTPHNSISGKFDKRTNEYLADVFASYLLMPDDAILNFIPDTNLKKDKITLETILKTEHYFKCSRTALLFRLKELSVITDAKFEEYKQDIKLKAKQNGYSTKLYEKGNENQVIGDFGSKSRYLFENEKISESHYLTLLNSIGIDLFND
jgi:Zn-dependent peptidase ImmA (M78 family)